MAAWLYQMNHAQFSHERYRNEVWEGTQVTNWGGGEAKRRPKDVQSGDILVLFYSKTNAPDPGIYGWGVVTYFDEETVNFRPVFPSDYLKMNPIVEGEVSEIIKHIRGPVATGTMWKIEREDLDKIRDLISECMGSV